MEKYIMKRTGILCPNCFKKKLLHEKGVDLYCDECGEEFIFTDKEQKTVRYKNSF